LEINISAEKETKYFVPGITLERYHTVQSDVPYHITSTLLQKVICTISA